MHTVISIGQTKSHDQKTVLWKELQNYMAKGVDTGKSEKLGSLKLLPHTTSCLIQAGVPRASFRYSSNLFEVWIKCEHVW